jgi:hypothetical protein
VFRKTENWHSKTLENTEMQLWRAMSRSVPPHQKSGRMHTGRSRGITA